MFIFKERIQKFLASIFNTPYGIARMTTIILRGTLLVVSLLTLLLIISAVIIHPDDISRPTIGIIVILYLLVAELLVHKKKFLSAAWMIIILLGLISMAALLTWSLNNSMGILTIGFVVFLSGTLLGTKYILPVTIGIILMLCLVQVIHLTGIISPDLSELSKQSRFIDVLAYATIISIFSLISWLSGKQTERLLQRAQKAEDKIKAEKNNLAEKLEEQSTVLRQLQLQEMASLYKFAAIGQSTTATLHELSNQLSILTLDIDDIQMRHRQSKAILNAKEGIENINLLVQQTRKQLRENTDIIKFNALPVIEQVLKEVKPKFDKKSVNLIKYYSHKTSFKLMGDPSNLSHVLTIILNNAFDACANKEDAEVKINVKQIANNLEILIQDNGTGIATMEINKLFLPHKSTKASGLGIGLYVAKNIVNTQFFGKIIAIPSAKGAKFIISLPKYEKGSSNTSFKTLH